MDIQKDGANRIIKTIIAMGILLLAFFIQGAVVAIKGFEGIKSAVVRGFVLWGLVVLTIALYCIKRKKLSMLGFRRTNYIFIKELYYFIPLIVIALIPLFCGINVDSGTGMIFANLFLTLGIGFCEEIYFRGIICNLWLKRGEKTAIMVSSILFAVCHLMNLAGGANIIETILQICFAFVYGVVFALIFIACHSVWPCIILHTLHDFCSFISAEGTVLENIVLGSIQFTILLCYAVIIMKKSKATNPKQDMLGQ